MPGSQEEQEQEALKQAEIWMKIAEQSKQEGGGEQNGASDAADWAIQRSLGALGMRGTKERKVISLSSSALRNKQADRTHHASPGKRATAAEASAAGTSSGPDSGSLSRTDLDQAIEAGDWASVGATAALLSAGSDASDTESVVGMDHEGGRATSSQHSKIGAADVNRADELDKLVDQGDWEGVVAAAARYDKEETEKAGRAAVPAPAPAEVLDSRESASVASSLGSSGWSSSAGVSSLNTASVEGGSLDASMDGPRGAKLAPARTQPYSRDFTPEEQAAVAALARNVDIFDQLRKLNSDEQKAVAILAKNVHDFERSLESVRGLPEALEGASPEVRAYFRTFAGSFERTFVAARAISSGAVRVQLSSMKDQMLEGVLKAIGGGAEGCGVPFVGLISIVAAVLLHQRETRQANLFSVFQDFFEGHSRDQYLITYRKLAEQICLRSDFSNYSSRRKKQIKQDRLRVRMLLEPIKKRLQSSHLLSIEDLKPMEVKATADLSALTEGVLRLHQDDRGKFCALKDGGDKEKIEHLLRLLGLPDPSVNPTTARPIRRPNSAAAGTDAAQHLGEPSRRSAGESLGRSAPSRPDQSSRFREIEGEIRHLREQNHRLLSGNRRTEALQRRLDQLERRVGSESDVETGVGGGVQAQAQLRRNRNVHSRDEGATELAAYQEVLLELRELRAGLAEVAERADVANFNTFLLSRVLQQNEALKLMEAILRLAGVEISASGGFKLDGKRHKLGFVSSGLLSKSKYLWKGAKGVKITQEYDGAKPVVYWFEKCGLSYLYAKHIRTAAMQAFKSELLLVSSDSTGVKPSMGLAHDRQQLFV